MQFAPSIAQLVPLALAFPTRSRPLGSEAAGTFSTLRGTSHASNGHFTLDTVPRGMLVACLVWRSYGKAAGCCFLTSQATPKVSCSLHPQRCYSVSDQSPGELH
jgi:hypothetical protein